MAPKRLHKRLMTDKFTGSFTQQEPIPDAAIDAAMEVLRHGRLHRYNVQPDEAGETALLEEEFATLTGARYCLAVASGGYAMATALRAVGVKPGDKVLTNAFTLAPVPGSIASVGAEPVFVGVTEGLTIDLEDLQTKADQADVLLLSHMRGHICDMDRLMQICNAHNIHVVEDCAHTMGATWRGRLSGTDGVVGCYSTQTYKHLNSGEGGLLISDDPFRDFNKITKNFNPFTAATASITSSASIGVNTVIQPNAFVGNNVVIGENCIIHSNVSIYDNTVIGDNVIIHANTVIGADAFYYKKREDGFDRLLSGGNVVIEDRVEIGASCTIDKGVSGSTRIGYDSKLDNHIQVGHDTVIGKHCLIASQVGIAGCVVIEDHVTLWGQVGVTSGITIGEKAVLLAQSGIARSLEGGKTYFGSPAEEARKKYRELASVRMLPEIIEKITIQEN